MKSVTQNIRGVIGKHCLSKGILSQPKLQTPSSYRVYISPTK